MRFSAKVCRVMMGAAVCMATTSIYAAGVSVGSSSLISVLDYSDTFTGTADGGLPNRPYLPAVQPPAAYVLENNYGNPPRSFQIGAGFSFAADGVPVFPNAGNKGFVPGGNPYPGGGTIANTSGAGSDTGFTQTGGAVDYGINYGLRDEYWVQVDAVQTPDRIDITSGATLGIFGTNRLSVFFRGDGSGNASLYNGSVDTAIQPSMPTFNTGITGAGQWYNYAVRFDTIGKEIEIYVNEVSKGIIDLTTFAGGIYQNFSNAVVGAGGAGGDRVWTDNFQVGGVGAPRLVHPDPGNLAGLPSNLVSFWDFNEASGPQPDRLLDYAYDRQGDVNNGSFVGSATRNFGIVGNGSAQFNDVNGDGVNVGTNGYSFTQGITVEAMFATNWDGSDQAEFFRKEDGNNRILLSFQSAVHINNAFGQLVGTANVPGISLGLNTGGAYGELDVAFDGLDGRPTLSQINDGSVHHVVATYDVATGVKSIYLDGVLIASVDLPDGAALVTGGAAPALIGASGNTEPFTGLLDEVAIYNSAISASDVALHYYNVTNGGANYFSAPVIPEPATLALIALGGSALLRRRRSA